VTMLPGSREPTLAKRVIAVVTWSLVLALLFGVGGFIFQTSTESLSSRIVRFVTTGLLFGAVIGAIRAKIVTGWLSGAVVGMVCGAISGVVWWIATIALGIEGSRGWMLSLGIALLINVVGGAIAGIIFGLLMADQPG
jgi:hypothetical protein